MNVLVLAFLGDAVYDVYIREYLIKFGYKVKKLQEESIKYVSAKGQSMFLDKMIKCSFLTEEEIDIVRRGRNHKSHSNKSVDIVSYKKATGLECLIGYLKVCKKDDRIKEIMEFIVGDKL